MNIRTLLPLNANSRKGALFLAASVAFVAYGVTSVNSPRFRANPTVIIIQPADKKEIERTIDIRNDSDRPIRCVGGLNICGDVCCVHLLDQVPFEIAPGQMRSVRFEIHVRGNAGEDTFALWIDDGELHEASIVVQSRP